MDCLDCVTHLHLQVHITGHAKKKSFMKAHKCLHAAQQNHAFTYFTAADAEMSCTQQLWCMK